MTAQHAVDVVGVLADAFHAVIIVFGRLTRTVITSRFVWAEVFGT
jgi:hypothetical protein